MVRELSSRQLIGMFDDGSSAVAPRLILKSQTQKAKPRRMDTKMTRDLEGNRSTQVNIRTMGSLRI